jgi:phage/plasmid-like protein (TIGR03299 family)
MAHEITKSDHLVLASKGAWHGLGTVVANAPNPFAALRLAALEWTVEESAHIVGVFNPGETGEYRVATDASKVLVRSDNHELLGVVGRDYTPVQNHTLAELAYALRAAGDECGVEIESAGSIRGGKRVWFLIRTKSIEVGKRGDVIDPYYMLTNGHDGSESLKGFGTNTRVVCANTYRAAMGQARDVVSFRHTQRIGERVEEFARLINQWHANIAKGAAFANALAAQPMKREDIQALWVQVVQKIEGDIPLNPANGWEANRRDRATAALAHMAQVFDRESQQFGANAWVAANAATHWVQHCRSEYSIRKGDDQQRKYMAWNGTVADETAEVWELAAATL